MSAKIPRKETEKISELSVVITGVRVIEDARIMAVADTHVILRYRKTRSVLRRQQLFLMENILFLRDKAPQEVGAAADDNDEVEVEVAEGAEVEAGKAKAPKRFCTAVVLDTFEMDEFADIASIDKTSGSKVWATTTEGHRIIADTKVCRFLEEVDPRRKKDAPEVSIAGNTDQALAPSPAPAPAAPVRPSRAKAKFD